MAELETVEILNDETGEKEVISRSRRARVFKKGRMIFENGLRSLPCTVRNVSDGGAQLQFDEPHLLPKEFELQIDLDGVMVSCERRWEDGLDCGVMFVGEKREVTRKGDQSLKSSEEALPDKYNSPAVGANTAFQQSGASNPRPPAQPAPTGRSFGKRSTFGKRG